MTRRRRACVIVEVTGQTHTETFHDATWRVLRGGAVRVDGRPGEGPMREGAVYGAGAWTLRLIRPENCGVCGD